MYLNGLVGKMAIRTMEPVNPFDPLCVINDGLRGKIWSPTFGGRGLREYMDEPSKIVNVEGDQAIAVPIAELAAILEEAMKTNEKLRNEKAKREEK